MDLSVSDRIMMGNILSELKEGNFLTFKIINGIKDKLFIDEEESKSINMRIDDNKYLWDSSKETKKEFEFTEAETKLIVEQLKSLDLNKKLTMNHLSIYTKFIPE